MVDFSELDKTKEKLEGKNSGWQIWYVPHAIGPVIWCARPLPELSADTPEHLQTDIRATEKEWKKEGVRSG
jgi:hypothetical protein